MFMLPEGTMLSAFIGGAISKVINDGVDYTKPTIRSALNDKNNRNYSTKIYRVIEKSLNIITNNKHKDSNDLYDAIEKIFNEFKNHGDTLESVKFGLNVLGTDASDQRCENFLEEFYQEIRRDDDLYKAVMLDMHQKDIKISQEEFQKLNEKLDRNHREIVEKLYGINENLNGNSLVNEENTNYKDLVFENNKKQEYIKIWNSRLFLHAGKNEGIMTLADVFIMPDCQMHTVIQRLDFFCFDPLNVIIEEFVKYEKTSTMLITGVPGIGKSSITSWIANEYKDDDRFIILRFRDWDSKELKKGLFRAICNTLECKKDDLKNKILILDGFDEMKSLDIRERLLNVFFSEMKDWNNFKCIITSRPAYIDSSNFQTVIELRGFNVDNINIFYKNIKGSELTGRKK